MDIKVERAKEVSMMRSERIPLRTYLMFLMTEVAIAMKEDAEAARKRPAAR
ncbi:hypothetical protein J19TS2_03240 [Cohnella xylanilytica]|nr:hypothetical protein J19TS2_03240 [Cohnella xylanilytica]